jgi:tRNA threonylcarbamoyladenosine biosynthesis protein TsaE
MISNDQKYTTLSERETEEIAAQIADTLKGGDIIALHGNLGAGKTVFTRGLAAKLGVQEAIVSPTFTIIQEYKIKEKLWLFHLDLYRINNADSALAFGIDEYLEDSNAILVIEWPNRIAPILPETTIHIHIKHCGENQREIRVN